MFQNCSIKYLQPNVPLFIYICTYVCFFLRICKGKPARPAHHCRHPAITADTAAITADVAAITAITADAAAITANTPAITADAPAITADTTAITTNAPPLFSEISLI
jgi:hypothetical protein